MNTDDAVWETEQALAQDMSIKRGRRESWAKVLFRNPLVILSCIYIAGVCFVAVFAPLLASYPPHYTDIYSRLLPPGSPGHLLGTDQLGRDVLSRMIYGARTSFYISILVTVSVGALGITIGIFSGLSRKADEIIMRITDMLMSLPPVIAGLALMAVLGPSITNLFIVLVVVFTPRVARVARGETLVVREATYIKAVQSMKGSLGRIIFKHILPNIASPLIVQLCLMFGGAIVTEAALSFLGIGSPPEIPSWGNILSDGRIYIRGGWWLSIVPGTAIFLAVLAFNLLGDALRDVNDPRQYGR
ncbi:MAG: putative D,D-dipeptide transport system permease protein DdpC [Syntrophomonadaceae bacterium]|nr:putative D,D-dipeptide transport system permease protein DdpC [Bacillota bacterium]